MFMTRGGYAVSNLTSIMFAASITSAGTSPANSAFCSRVFGAVTLTAPATSSVRPRIGAPIDLMPWISSSSLIAYP